MGELALIGVLEAVVYLFRYRTAVGRAWLWSGFWAFAVCSLRAAFVVLGVSAWMADASLIEIIAAYAIPAGIGTSITHALCNRSTP